MKGFVFFLVLTLLPTVANAQDSLLTVFKKKYAAYEFYRKSEVKAVILSSLLPSSGLFYTHNDAEGLVFLAAHAGAITWAVNAASKHQDLLGPVIANVGLLWLDDYVSVLFVEKYNEKVRVYFLSSAGETGIGVRLSFGN